MKTKTPDSRLRAAAGFVRQGAVFADIGTDHAFLPVFLLKEGIASRAYAADINEGPLSRARAHIAESGLSHLVTPVLTDGLSSLDGRGITDIAICGMGGELIADILSRAPFVKDKSIRLILQPMTRAAHLRRFLAREGFAVIDECVTRAAGKLYFCLAAEYTGAPYSLSRIEAELGRKNLEKSAWSEEFVAICKQKLASAKKCVEGAASAGRVDEEEKEYYEALLTLLQKGEVT